MLLSSARGSHAQALGYTATNALGLTASRGSNLASASGAIAPVESLWSQALRRSSQQASAQPSQEETLTITDAAVKVRSWRQQ